MMEDGSSVTQPSVTTKSIFKKQGLILARGSIDSDFDNQLRDDLDVSIHMGGSKISNINLNTNSVTMMKAPYGADGSSYSQSINTGIGQPSYKKTNEN